MEHILDNMIWNGLTTGNKTLAKGNEMAKYMPKEVSLFVGINTIADSNFNILYNIIPFEGTFMFVSPDADVNIPKPWQVIQKVRTFQLVYNEVAIPAISLQQEFIPLNDQHIPQILDLVKLTNPGPFAERTIEYGHYFGIFDGDKLVAMAGQRINPVPYAEISAVCTHPDYLGRGYASQLLVFHINRIREAGQIPFLQVKNENERALQVYLKVGFTIRSEMYFYVIKK